MELGSSSPSASAGRFVGLGVSDVVPQQAHHHGHILISLISSVARRRCSTRWRARRRSNSSTCGSSIMKIRSSLDSGVYGNTMFTPMILFSFHCDSHRIGGVQREVVGVQPAVGACLGEAERQLLHHLEQQLRVISDLLPNSPMQQVPIASQYQDSEYLGGRR